jgi:hypothetical protein
MEPGHTATRAQSHAGASLPPPHFPLLTRNVAAGDESRPGHGGRRCQGYRPPKKMAREHHHRSLSMPQTQPSLRTAGARGSMAAHHGHSSAMAAARVPAVQGMEQAINLLNHDLPLPLIPLSYPERTQRAGRKLPTRTGRRWRSGPKQKAKIRRG